MLHCSVTGDFSDGPFSSARLREMTEMHTATQTSFSSGRRRRIFFHRVTEIMDIMLELRDVDALIYTPEEFARGDRGPDLESGRRVA